MRIPVHLQAGSQSVDSSALVDCGATNNFIDISLVPRLRSAIRRLPQPLTAYNVDGTTNHHGTIKFSITATVYLSNYREKVTFLVTSLGSPRVILGITWLKKANPQIDWSCNTLTPPDAVAPLRESPPGQVEDKEDQFPQHLGKITLSTQLAQQELPKSPQIPSWLSEFKDVFSEKMFSTLPPHRSFDHTIELKPSFVPKIAKIYPLNPKEKEACETFVKENLQTGRIIPSKSP